MRAFLVPCLALILILGSAFAQQSPNYVPPAGYRQQPDYGAYQTQRPGVGDRVGGFVKRLFYGERQTSYPQTQSRAAYQSGRSLDAPPTHSRSIASVSSAPPSAAKTKPAVTPTPASKPKTTSKPAVTASKPSSKYTPPRIKPETSTPKIEPKPAPQLTQQTPPAPAPAPTFTPPAPDSAPALDNKPTPAPNTVASLNNTLPGSNAAELTPAPEPTSAPKQTPAPSSNSSDGQFLVGKKTAAPGRVVSPYPPYQELDVTGLSSGSLALDPTTDKVFQIP